MNKVLTFFSIFISLVSSGQSDSLWALQIPEIEIVSENTKEDYFAGSTIIKNDSISKTAINSKSIESLITKNLPIYIKSDAGGLATIRVRGTSADHTAIMLNCINLNSLTLGHSDLFSMPLFLVDGVDFQYGSASSMYGSDAIGGSLHLKTASSFERGISISAQKDIGSFHSNFEGVKLRQATNRLEFKLKAYQNRSRNDFTFDNQRFGEKSSFVDTQRNASFQNWGIWNELNVKLSRKATLTGIAWYNNSWHEVQPVMTANSANNSFNFLDDQNLRTLISYRKPYRKSELNLSAAFVWDESIYNGNKEQTIATKRGIIQAEYENSAFLNIKQLAGVQLSYISPEVYSYKEALNEKRGDFYYSLNRSFIKRIFISAGIRKSFVIDYAAPFCPSLGVKFNAIKHTDFQTDIRASFAQSYKIPTFNDRFWGTQGDPNLHPESGNCYELGIDSKFRKRNILALFSSNIFYLDVNDWINWVLKGDWVPVNYSHVVSKGIELSGSVSYKFKKTSIKARLNYSVTNAQNITDGEEPSKLDYLPKYISLAGLTVKHKLFLFSFDCNYTGQRFIRSKPLSQMTPQDVLPSHTLFSSDIMFTPPVWKQNSLAVIFSVQNLLNTEYFNQDKYAMPGRSYRLSIRYSFNETL